MIPHYWQIQYIYRRKQCSHIGAVCWFQHIKFIANWSAVGRYKLRFSRGETIVNSTAENNFSVTVVAW